MAEETDDWQFDFEWLQTRHQVKDMLGAEKLPDLQVILMMIGIQELGKIKKSWTKEEKQDLMHIAVCRLLSEDGYYEFEALDAEGWPHWRQVAVPTEKGVKAQELLLKTKVIQYFNQLSNS